MPHFVVKPPLIDVLASPTHDQISRAAALRACTPAQLRNHLSSCLSSAKAISDMAQVAYTHQLGFDKITLSTGNPNQSCVRLHFWPQPMSGWDTDIHSHCADFVSKILYGNLSSQEYRLDKTGIHYHHNEYCFDFNVGHSKSLYLGTTRLILGHMQTLVSGAQYSRAANELHQTVNVAEKTLTLSIWGSREYAANVMRTELAVNGSDTRSLGMRPDYLENRLRQIINLLGESIDSE